MVRHNNPTISLDATRILNLKAEGFDSELTKLTPVIQIKPKTNIVRSQNCFNATSATVYTTPADKDFYLISAVLSTSKDATATSTTTSITTTIDGGSGQDILRLGLLTLTSERTAISTQFNPPIKIDRNVAITVKNETAVGNMRSVASIAGYTVETSTGE